MPGEKSFNKDDWSEKDYEKGESSESEKTVEEDEESKNERREKLSPETKERISSKYPQNKRGEVLTETDMKEMKDN